MTACGVMLIMSMSMTKVAATGYHHASTALDCLLQGCMNNLTFGDTDMGYYETIAGGAGAGPGWHGRSGVHTHMTNTRITDPGQMLSCKL